MTDPRKMPSERRLRIKTLVMVLAMVVCANAGDLMLKRGMSQIGAVQLTASGLAQAFRLTVASGTIWVAILFLIGFMLSYMTVLSWADYSYVMPAAAFGFALLTWLAGSFLSRPGFPPRWVVFSLDFSPFACYSSTQPPRTP